MARLRPSSAGSTRRIPSPAGLPSPGTITGLRPAAGPWVREDSGAYEGYTVPRWYDTLLAKLIVWGADRPAAIDRMIRALSEYTVVGVRTTIPALQRIVAHPDFRAGRLSTALLERVLARPGLERGRSGAHRRHRGRARRVRAGPPRRRSASTHPRDTRAWRSGARLGWQRPAGLVKYVATVGGTSEVVEISGGDGRYLLTIGDRRWEVDGRASARRASTRC